MATKPKLYSFDDHPADREQLKPWVDKWIANVLSTKPMDDEERDICRAAVVGMYEAAGLPAPKNIVFVPSPMVLAFAGGFSAWRWYCHHHPEDSTAGATDRATTGATEGATEGATDRATAATYGATTGATTGATYVATHGATAGDQSPTMERWYVSDICDPGRALELADKLGVGQPGLDCAARVYSMWQDGNQCSAYDSYLSFFQDIAKLPLDYSAYNHWRALAEHSGPRVVHADFCMISERPEILTVDAENRPHNDTGPFCRWRDGTALYAVHGVRIPAWIIECPERLAVAEIDAEPNAEVRRVMIECYGSAKYVVDSGAVVVNEETDEKGLPMALLRRAGTDGPMQVVRLTNSTPDPDGSYRVYHIRVSPEHRTCFAARNAGYRQPATMRFAVRT